MANNGFFERAQNEVDVRMESTLTVADPMKLCEDYIAQNPNSICEKGSIEAIIASGYGPCLKDFFEWFINPNKGRINTYVFQGKTATGKTQLKERIEQIFPCQEYLQQCGTNFSVD